MEPARDRLTKALDYRKAREPGKWSMNRLSGETKARGSSYGSVHNYLNGKSEPPLEFLIAAADVLRVNREYLAFGRGHMTEAESEVTAAGEASVGTRGTSPHQLALELKREVLEELGVPKPDPPALNLGQITPADSNREEWEAIPSWVAPLAEIRAYMDIETDSEIRDTAESGLREEAAHLTWVEDRRERDARGDYRRALRAFMDELHIDAALMSDPTRDHFILSMIPIFLSLVPERYAQAMAQIVGSPTTPAKEETDGNA